MTANPTVVFPEPGQVLVEQRSVPVPAAGEVLIRTSRSLISTGTELTVLGGRAPTDSAWGEFVRFPYTAGYSNSGVVLEVGAGVDRQLTGQRVLTRTAHAAFNCCPVELVQPIPEAVSDEEAPFCTLGSVVLNGLRRGRLAVGESVAVTGLGILGQLCVRLSVLMGAAAVFAIDVAERRLRWIPEQPYCHRLPGLAKDQRERILELNRGRLVDIVVEASANAAAIPGQFRLLRDEGRMIVLSSPLGTTELDFHDHCNRGSYTIIGAHGFSQPAIATPDNPWTKRRNAELLLDYVATSRLPVADLVSHRFPFNAAPEAYALLSERRDEALGVILEWED